jgi:hypothetical protein
LAIFLFWLTLTIIQCRSHLVGCCKSIPYVTLNEVKSLHLLNLRDSFLLLAPQNDGLGDFSHSLLNHGKNECLVFRQKTLARIFHESPPRDREDGRATRQPQGVGSEAYLNGTSQVPAPEDARKDGHIRGHSR